MDKQDSIFIGLIAVALAVTIPIAYSAMEPSIIINMISGQVEKPLQIKDSGGSEVFSVDVDGTIFPSSAGGVSGIFGTEIVLVDNSGNTGGANDSGFNDGIMSEVTLPTDAPQYRITAVEVLTDFVSDGENNRICIILADIHGFGYPIPDDELFSIGILSGWSANSILQGDLGHVIEEDTVYKIDIVPVILDGGQTFIVLVNECDNGTDIEFVTGASGSSFEWDLDQTDIIDGGHFEGEADFSTLTTGKMYEGFAFGNAFGMYLKVYGQPLE